MSEAWTEREFSDDDFNGREWQEIEMARCTE